ncbi:hypothetical protein [Streptomyces sp. PTY087I2]|uniref:hypothetical protein n=1 Tax=Streptomyces sp. PTY087I2 TaxID=1819298 RepID=UPI00080BF253|nr:hypothetical protein [Streptomyces sp. PTY087I2]OCC09868.1 hypothetical protein A3Q37_04457 [Streptomyces sp. PTY087I2]
MKIRIRHKKTTLFTSIALLLVASLTSLYCWWNTNAWGDDAVCEGTLSSGDVQATLDVPGRVSQVSSQTAIGRSEFTCVVERTSRFIGQDNLRMKMKTGTAEGAFPFTTAVWKNPAARSYFARGAVSDTSGYVILPRSCWDKVGNIQGSRTIAPGPDTVAIVEASVEGGSAHRRSLARLLTHTAQKVAKAAGCSADEPAEPAAFVAPDAPRTAAPHNLCGLKGFSLPKAALAQGLAEPGHEQLNEASHTWACDVDLDGTDGARISFAATTDNIILDAALREEKEFKKLPGANGSVVGTDEAILQCAEGKVYFAANWSAEYQGVLLDRTHNRQPSYSDVRRATFQNFLDAAAASRNCPQVTMPR